MKGVICLFLLLSSSLSQEDDIDALLFYEDQTVLQIIGGGWFAPNVNALTLKRQIHKDQKKFADFTLCFRANFLFYTDNWVHTPIHMKTDKYANVNNPDTGQSQDFWTNLITTLYGTGGYGMWMSSFVEFLVEVIAENGVYSIQREEVINTNQWQSMCTGFDAKQRSMYFVQNGKTLINITQPKIWGEKNQGFDTTMIGPVKLHFGEENFDEGIWYTKWSGFMIGPNAQPFSGYLTDIQIYGKSLTTEDMHEITSCKLSKEGDIYSWNADDWEPFDKELQKNKTTAVQYRKVKVQLKSLCKEAEKYTYFPDLYSLSGSVDLCRRFGGKLIDVSTSAKANAVAMFVGKKVKENPKFAEIEDRLSSFTMYNDEEEFNVWRHRDTDELPSDPLIWNIGEPNGGMLANCAELMVQLSADKSSYIATVNDMGCDALLPVACEDIGDLLFTLRGICKNSLIDTTFTMVEGDKNMKRFLAGNLGWRIFWDDTGKLWRLNSPKAEFTYGTHTEFQTYPLGKNYWSIVNDTRCSYPNTEKVLLNLSPCNSTSFTCNDGTCVPMIGR